MPPTVLDDGRPARPLRVLLVEHLSPTNEYARTLCDALCSLGVRVTVLCGTDAPGPWPRGCRAIRVFPGFDPGARTAKLLRYVGALLVLVFRLACGDQDVVHVQSLRLAFTEWVPYRLLSWRRPIIVTVHNVAPHEGGFVRRLAHAQLYRSARGLVFHTRHSVDRLPARSLAPLVRRFVIPHFAYRVPEPSDLEQAVCRRTLGLPDDVPVVLFFGLLRRYKGLDILLRAYAAVLEEHPDALLVIAGKSVDQGYLDECRRLIRGLVLTDRVVHHDRPIERAELGAYFRASDLVALPYRRIDQSGVLLMAYSWGRPVLASAVGGFLEAVRPGSTGFLFEAGNVQSAAAALSEALADRPRLERMGDEAGALAVGEYSVTEAARRTVEAYRELLRGEG